MNDKSTVFQVLLLILICIVSFHLFLFQKGLIFEDWGMLAYVQKFASEGNFPKSTLLDSDRPLGHTLNCLTCYLFKFNPLPYHILLLLYDLIASIGIYFLLGFILESRQKGFIAAIIFILMPNTIESHQWSNSGFMRLSFCIYVWLMLWGLKSVRNKRWGVLYLISFLYFVTLLIYEQGLLMPLAVFLIVYIAFRDSFKEDRKRLNTFLILSGVMLLFVAVMKFTHLFGFGKPLWSMSDGMLKNMTNPSLYLNNILTLYGYYFGSGIEETVKSAVFGLRLMNKGLLLTIFIINLGASLLVYQMIQIENVWESKKGKALLLIGLALFMLFILPLFPYNYFSSRHFAFTNIGFAILAFVAISAIRIRIDIKRELFSILIFILLCINQGDSYNWIVAGRLNQGLFEYVRANRDRIIKSNPQAIIVSSGNEGMRRRLDTATRRYPTSIRSAFLNGGVSIPFKINDTTFYSSVWVYVVWQGLSRNDIPVITDVRPDNPVRIEDNMVMYWDKDKYRTMNRDSVFIIDMTDILRVNFPHLYRQARLLEAEGMSKEIMFDKPSNYYIPFF
jgi:hypothetical protein